MRTMADEWRTGLFDWSRDNAPKLIAILLVALILLQLLRFIVRKLNQHSKTVSDTGAAHRGQQMRTLASVIASMGAFVIYFVALMQALPLFGVDVRPILASAGIVGLAVGFGAQTLVKDVINGFFILLENHFDVGDVVRVAGVTGTVEAMTLRRTVLRDASGAVHIVPNSEIKVLSNMTRDWAQVSLQVSVDYHEPSDKVTNALEQVATEVFNDASINAALVAMPEVAGIERVTGLEVEYLVLAKVMPNQQYRVSRELRRRIKEAFERQGIKTPGPARIVLDQSAK